MTLWPEMSLHKAKLLLAMIMVFFVLATIYIFTIIVERQQSLREISRYNTTWLISQAVGEFLRLEQKIAAYGFGGAEGDSDEVELRFEILLNRIKLLSEGEVREFIQGDVERHRLIHELYNTVLGLHPIRAQLVDRRSLSRAMEALKPFDQKLAALASAAHRVGAANVDEDQQALLRLHWLYTGVVAGLIACGVSLMLLLLWHNRQLEGTHIKLNDITSELESKTHLLQTTVDTIDQGLIMVDGRRRVQVYNRRLVELLKLDPEFLTTSLDLEALEQFQATKGDLLHMRVAPGSSHQVEVLELQRSDGSMLEVRTARLPAGGAVRTSTLR